MRESDPLKQRNGPEAREDILEMNWADSRKEHGLHKTCLSLRAACMNHTLVGSAKETDKYIKIADALRNRCEWVLDKKHTYRRMILTGDMPSWLQPVDVMVKHHAPIWCLEDPLSDQYSAPSPDSPWTITHDETSPDASRAYKKFMTDPVNIARCLKTKNSLSALGLDGIGYLFLKLGCAPMIELIAKVFKKCVKFGNVPETWKKSKTVFLYKKGDMTQPWNWRPITITSFLYRLYMAMNATFIQLKMHKQDNIWIFSNSQKGFVARVPGCMERAIMTRELIAHAIHNKRDLHVIQIDFTNAFGSVPHGLIEFNMRCMRLPESQIRTVMKIYEGATTVIAVPTGASTDINWRSGTVQGCPLSPTLFNICLESFLRLMDKNEYRQYAFKVAAINVAAYADDLILFSETCDGVQAMPDALADFCNYSGMEVNVRKCASVSITKEMGKLVKNYEPFVFRKGRSPMDNRGMPIEEELVNYCHREEIPRQEASIHLGLPVGPDKEDCSLQGRLILSSMKDHIITLGKSNLNIAQKIEGIKFMELPRIDYRMMCADLSKADLEDFDVWLRGQVQSWFHMRGVPSGMAGLSWRDGGFTLPSLQERQNTMAIRTICDIMTSNDPEIRKMMEYFEEEQAARFWYAY
jgi:hypothetical protein